MQEQFKLLEPNKNGYISLQNLKTVSLFTYYSFQNLIFAHFAFSLLTHGDHMNEDFVIVMGEVKVICIINTSELLFL